MATQIVMRRDTAANWALANPILAAGEPGFNLDTQLFRVGDGVTHWTSLVEVGAPAVAAAQAAAGVAASAVLTAQQAVTAAQAAASQAASAVLQPIPYSASTGLYSPVSGTSPIPSVDPSTKLFPVAVRQAIATNLGDGLSLEGAALRSNVMSLLAANARAFGAIADGISHPLSNTFSTLAAAKAVYPAATALTDETDWAAIMKALSVRGGAYLPDTGASYVINKPITLTGQKWVQGDPAKSAVSQTANNERIIQCTGTPRVENLILDYTRQEASNEPNARCIELTNVNGGAVFRNLSLRRGAYGIYNAGAGYTFSSSFMDIDINGFSVSAIDISNAGGITGNLLQNVYVHNNYYGTATPSSAAPVVLSGWDDGVINQMNIEYCNANQMLQINQARNLSIIGLHLEGNTMLGQYGGLVELIAAGADRVFIAGLSVIGNNFTTANISSTISAIFKVADATALDVVGFSIRGNTVNISNMSIVYVATGTTGQAIVDIKNVQTDASWRDVVGDQPRLIALRTYGSDVRWRKIGGALEVAGTAAPTSFTWAAGDHIRNTVLAEQGTTGAKYVVTGWDCVAAGTPGTWVARRSLTGN